MTDARPDRSSTAELRSTLRALRTRAGLSTRALAAQTQGKVSQSKVSRMESPDQPEVGPPPIKDVEAILTALADVLEEGERDAVLALAADAHEERTTSITTRRVLLQKGYANTQRMWRRHENASERVGVFHPSIVPGLAQTEGYLREVFGPDADSPAGQAWLTERLGRIADRTERSATLLLTEGTVTQPVSDAEVGAQQCERLAELAMRTSGPWRIGVIPAVLKPGQTYHHPPQNGFDLYDDKVIVLGTTAGFGVTEDSKTVEDHIALFRRLEGLAVFDEEAAVVFRRAAARYRGLR